MKGIRVRRSVVVTYLKAAGWAVVRFLSASAAAGGCMMPPPYIPSAPAAPDDDARLTRDERRRWDDLERRLRV